MYFQYDFSLEHKVIAWAESQRQSKEAMIKAEMASELEKLEKSTKDPEPVQSNGAAVVVQEGSGTESGPEESVISSATEGQSATSTRPKPPPRPPPPRAQDFVNLGSSMLVPTPFSASNATNSHQGAALNQMYASSSPFDLQDFENVQDPFENLELKTLNDIELLDKVLQATQPVLPSETVAPPQVEANAHNSPPGDSQTVAVSDETEVKTLIEPPHMDLKDVDYPEIESLSLTDLCVGGYDVTPQNTENHPQTSAASAAGQTTMIGRQYYSGAGVPSSVPDMGYSQKMMTASTEATDPANTANPPKIFDHHTALAPIPTNNPFYVQQQQQQQQQQPSNGPTYQHNVNNNNQSATVTLSSTNPFAKSPWTETESTNCLLINKLSVQYKPTSGLTHSIDENCELDTQSPINPLRNAKSTPDISGSEERRLPPKLPSSHTPPPYKTSRSNTPPPRPSTQQVGQMTYL